MIHTADIQDRDGAPLVLTGIIRRFPWLRHVFADGGYAGNKLRNALAALSRQSIIAAGNYDSESYCERSLVQHLIT